ncbi:hypothetical protein B0H19DRAFT_1259868 [Mycena capillaripes]|nr:hypothetical protein B0H19DRAFT_1259868 [Mycena capillaripes]
MVLMLPLPIPLINVAGSDPNTSKVVGTDGSNGSTPNTSPTNTQHICTLLLFSTCKHVRRPVLRPPGGSSAARGKNGRARRSPSPDWNINSQDFAGSPSREDSGGSPEKEQSPFVPSHASSLSHPSSPQSRDPEEPDSDDAISQAVRETQAQNARAVCRARFQKLVKAHKADQTRSLQKNSTDEEVDEHIKLLIQVVELVNTRDLQKDERSAASRKKADVETKAALELRDAAMRGLVWCETLTDVAQLEGASVRERQGQRNHKRRHAEIASESDKENQDGSDEESKPKRKHGRNQLVEVIKHRNTADAKQLEKARRLDEQRHEQMQQLQQCSIDLQENLLDGFGSTYSSNLRPTSPLTVVMKSRSAAVKRLNVVPLMLSVTQACFKHLAVTSGKYFVCIEISV